MKVALVLIQNGLLAHGLRVLSSCLKEAGHETELLFVMASFDASLYEKKLDSVIDKVSDADIVGISVMSNLVPLSRRLSRRLREEAGKTVIWGGAHPTVMPEECIREADYVFRGEAEVSLVRLLDYLEDGGDPSTADIPGVCTARHAGMTENVPPAPRAENLDAFPLPDIDLSSQYYVPVDECDIRRVTPEIFRQHEAPKGAYGLMVTRGCVYACSYCINSFLNTLHGGVSRLRYRSAGKVIEEIEQARALLGIQSVRIDDDAFMMMPLERIREFAELYSKRIGLPIYNFGASLLDISQEKMRILVDAGMVYMRVGIQSASESTRRMYNRRGSVEQMREAMTTVEKFMPSMEPLSYDIIVDNPWEPDVEYARTLRFLARLKKPYRLFVYALTFFPGTPLFERAVEEGLVSDIERDVYGKAYFFIKDTYLNQLLFLLRELAREGRPFPPLLMDILTSRLLLDTFIGKKLCVLLKLLIKVVRRCVRVERQDDLAGGIILRILTE